MSSFKEYDWKHFYTTAKEAIPDNDPSPKGKYIDIRISMDSDRVADTVTWRSRTKFFISLNMDPVVFYFKKQITIESSIFGVEFVALKIAMETAICLCCKLRMIRCPFDSPTYMYGVNMSVIHNTQRPEYTLKESQNIFTIIQLGSL